MEDKLSQLKKFKQVTLNDEERGIIRAHIARVMIDPPKLVSQSLFQRGVTHGLRIALSTMLFVVFVGSSVSAVAANALPGDPLYSFKINVNEEIKGWFLRTPEEKALWQKSRIENRVSEIKTLAATKSLTKAKQATAQKAIDDHVQALSKDLATLSTNAPSTALSVTTSLEQTLKEGKSALVASDTTDDTTDTSDDQTGTDDAIKTVDDTLNKVSQQEVKIISKEIDDISDQVNNSTDPSTSQDTQSDDSDPDSIDTSISTTSTTSVTPASP